MRSLFVVLAAFALAACGQVVSEATDSGSSSSASGVATGTAAASTGTAAASTTGGATSAASSTGGGTSSGGSSTGGSSTGAVQTCAATGFGYEYSACSVDSDCLCPAHCEATRNGDLCIAVCNTTADCPGAADGCTQRGFCEPQYCLGLDGTCTNTTAGDGTCVPFDSGSQSYGYCFRGGSSVGTCDDGLWTSGAQPDASLTCPVGSLCDNAGTCRPACNPRLGDECPAGELCAPALLSGYSSALGFCEPVPGGVDAGQGSARDAFPLIDNAGGPTIPAPKIVTLSFQGDDAMYQFSSYADWIATSDWLTTVGANYGVGDGAHIVDLEFPWTYDAGTTLADSDVQTFLANLVQDGGVPWDGGSLLTDPAVIYMIYYPTSTTILYGNGASCQFFDGYHGYFIDSNGNGYTYAVLPNCTAQGAPVETLAIATSHELIEAMTDPQAPVRMPGFVFDDVNESWSHDYSEVADVCYGQVVTEDGGYVAQRVWSATLAAAGAGSPCAPVPSGEIYFNVSPLGPNNSGEIDFATASPQSQDVVFTLTGWSSAPTGDWDVYLRQTEQTFQPTVVLSQNGQTVTSATMNAGTTATLTFTIPGGLTSGDFATVEVLSSQDGLQSFNQWPVTVAIP